METLSSNTLFHFTGSAAYLVSILQEGFKPRYCLEDFSMFDFILGAGEPALAVPMVCFCDIPLSKVKDHIGKYGSFGIGLTKEWGIKEKVSPLIYVNENSATTLGLSNAMSNLRSHLDTLNSFGYRLLQDEKDDNDLFYKYIEYKAKGEMLPPSLLTENQIKIYNKFLELNSTSFTSEEAYDSLFRLIRFTKPYFAPKWRKWSAVRFYDEREWRFVPDIQLKRNALAPWISKAEYDNDIGREQLNYRLGQQFLLKFKPEDIKYIIVEKESQVPAMIREIDNSGKYTREAIKSMLKSKVLTKQQIFEDF